MKGSRRARLAEVASLLGRWSPLFLLVSLAACTTGASAVPAAPSANRAAGCSVRVIVSFAQGGAPSSPDAAFLHELSSSARVALTYVRSLTPALHVLMLRADDADDPDCQRALARLRSDPRVRSADIDQRRQPQR